jgi:parvulin-like peptidyl-prolyl isomerase
MKIRRIVIIVAVVFLVGIASWVGYGSYKDYKARVGPLHEVAIEVNGVPFTMEYFVKMLDIYVGNYIYITVNTYYDFYVQAYPNATSQDIIQLLTSNAISTLSNNTNNITDMITDKVADGIIDGELLRKGAKNLGIEVTAEEIDAGLTAQGWSNEKLYRDIVSANLTQEKLVEYFDSQIPDTMEQAHVQVMLVESQEVADEVITKIEAGGNFTALVAEFSCNSSVEGDLGWLPRELMPNTLIADAAFNITPGEIKTIYDETAIKDTGTTGGCWLVRVVDRGDHELVESVRNALVDKHFNDWFEEWKKNSTIENLLDASKISWAVNKVLEGRSQ